MMIPRSSLPTHTTMIQNLDTPTATRWFANVIQLDEPAKGAKRRREDTSAEVLAHEIARYMPELARDLVASGRRKLMLAA